MAEEQLEWVFDSLIEFLRGPVWNIPILTFVEQKSVVFEPGSVYDGEFKKIHEEYKNLVDYMLGSYMEDLKITPEQFEKACTVASKKALTQFHKSLFEQVWAADDFEIFHRMMVQKNLELQLQALEVLASKFGLSPDFLNPSPDCGSQQEIQEEENIMKEIIRKTLEETVEQQKQQKLQKQKPNLDAVVNSQKEAMQVAYEEKSRLEAERSKEKQLMEQAMKHSAHKSDAAVEEEAHKEPASTPNSDHEKSIIQPVIHAPSASLQQGLCSKEKPDDDHKTSPVSPSVVLAPPVKSTPNVESTVTSTPVSASIVSAPPVESTPKVESTLKVESTSTPKVESPSTLISASAVSPSPVESTPKVVKEPNYPPEERPWSEGNQVIYTTAQVEASPMDLERRQNYLRQQRDKLLAMKKQERTKHLNIIDDQNSQQRPKSARAARKMLSEVEPTVDSESLAFRKSLASRLRSEVVDSNC